MVRIPEYLIIGTKDLIEGYVSRTYSYIIDEDLIEIVTQIIQVLLNSEYDTYTGNAFPDFNRLINKTFLDNKELNKIFTEETLWLLELFHKRLDENGVYCDNTLPYFFDRFLGKDIILKHLPF